jgi:hypothetical protein
MNTERLPPDEPEEEDPLEEGVWELDPNDPTHPDYDLSEAAGYATWEPEPKPLFLRNGVILAVAILVIIALVLPALFIIF